MGRAKWLVLGIVACGVGIAGLALLLDVMLLDARLAREGISRTARVVRLVDADTGDGHEYWAELDLDLGDGTTRRVEYAMVSEELARQGGAGSTWNVVMLPDQPNDFYSPADRESTLRTGVPNWGLTACAA